MPARPAETRLIAPALNWTAAKQYTDILYEKCDGIAKITINRPEVRNAFRPQTLFELKDAFADAHEDAAIGVVILTGAGGEAFCSGGDQRVRGHGGYVGDDGVPRLNVLDLQRQIRTMPKPVIAMVAGLRHRRRPRAAPRLRPDDRRRQRASSARPARRSAASTPATARRSWRASSATRRRARSGTSAASTTRSRRSRWASSTPSCRSIASKRRPSSGAREMLEKSPIALRFLKAAFNADTDGLAGLQQLAGDATLLYYLTEEAKEGRDAFVEKRTPDFSKFPRLP